MSASPTPLELLQAWDVEALRAAINRYGPYAGAGVVVDHVAGDASEVRVRLPLTADNANLVGTQFGGSLYSMVDPFLMILLVRRLGPSYQVWDKAATIDFLAPGTSEVHATIAVSDEEVETIRTACADGAPHRPDWTILVTGKGSVEVARVTKTLWVRKIAEEG